MQQYKQAVDPNRMANPRVLRNSQLAQLANKVDINWQLLMKSVLIK